MQMFTQPLPTAVLNQFSEEMLVFVLSFTIENLARFPLVSRRRRRGKCGAARDGERNARDLPGNRCDWKVKHKLKGNIMAKDKSTESVYRVTEVIGTSAQSWEDAAKTAVQTAAGTLRDLRIAEVVKMDVRIEDGKVIEYRTRLQLSFKYES